MTHLSVYCDKGYIQSKKHKLVDRDPINSRSVIKMSKSALKVVLLTESEPVNGDVSLPYKHYSQQLWDTIRTAVNELNYCCETVELNKLDFQEHESVNKFLNAHIVIMDVTNQDCRPTYMYHKGNRENVDCTDDIVLIQASNLENDDTMQDLKTRCKIKQLIIYRYDEEKKIFHDVTKHSANPSSLLAKNLKYFLTKAANNVQQGLSTRYLNRMEKRKNKVQNTEAERNYLWKEICDEILTETNQKFATPKLITHLLYAFRDMQDYQSMIELTERCAQYEVIWEKIQNHVMISYLTAFARSRRNEDHDREKALEILKRLGSTKNMESQLSIDITCLCGRIYKDKFTESNCQDKVSLEKAVEWYRQGFAAAPNLYAGINLLFLLAVTTDDLLKNHEAFQIIIQLNGLLGKKSRSLKDLNDYWDVATYFELHAIQHDWVKVCQAAQHMYLLDPPIWYLKSTINNLKILHRATRLRDQNRRREQPTTDENMFSFWIDFFSDAIKSNSTSPEERELPAQVPILVCDTYEISDSTTVNSIYVEAELQLNFHTGNEPETLVIRILEQPKSPGVRDLVKTIEMNSIRSIINVKRDSRAMFLYARDNSETFSSVELQLYFSSAERRTAFNAKIAKYRVEINPPEVKSEFDLEFYRDEEGQRRALGQGRYGKVYEAHDRITYKKFAVKEIPLNNPAYTEVAENEVKILSRLSHKNILRYDGTAIDSKKTPAVFQVIMEYVDGGSLLKHLSKLHHFREPSIQNYTRQILEGVQYLHENRILHRDIKSANVLLNSRGEIKIADFGTSKRLAGLHLCTEDNVGTPPYMSPFVAQVPPMGYGPEVDIWSVGCTVIEMATGKRPFHNITNSAAILLKLGIEKQSPDIPAHLSETAQDFLAKCFELTDKRPSAKDLLNHPFLKLKSGCTGEPSRNYISDPINSSSSLPRTNSEDNDMNLEPSRDLTPQVSIDCSRRLELATILRDKENQLVLLAEWIELVDEKRETELLTIDALFILLTGICDYLDKGNDESLKQALDDICDRTTIGSNQRIDLERAFYLFTKATNYVLSSKHILPPHVLFAHDNAIRRIAELLVGLIRPDFIPSVNHLIPSTPNHDTAEHLIDEGTRLHQQYQKLADENRKQIRRLIKSENESQMELTELASTERTPPPSSTALNVFFPAESPMALDNTVSNPMTTSEPHTLSPVSRGMKRSRDLLEVEEEHERLLKELIDNRARFKTILRSQCAS